MGDGWYWYQLYAFVVGRQAEHPTAPFAPCESFYSYIVIPRPRP